MKVNLSKLPTTAPKGVNEDKIKDKIAELHEKMIELQRIMYAHDKYSLLIVLQ
jgi:hypothetical protein